MSGPLPNQVCTWLPTQSQYEPDRTDREATDGQWLYCLRLTEPGDRQVVWRGVHGDGIVSVVDFGGAVRPRQDLDHGGDRPGYEGWGRITDLARPISVAGAQSHPALRRRFTRSIQNVQSLTPDEAQAISDCAGGLPRAASFEGVKVNWREKSGRWGQNRLPREKIVENIVTSKSRVARKLGFPSRANPDGKQKRLSNGRYPDLWCPDGVVGEVKNQVNAGWGPDQIEDYIEQCDAQWPEHRWRGVLVQGLPNMAPSAIPRLKESRYRRRLTVWTVQEGSHGRVTADQLFP